MHHASSTRYRDHPLFPRWSPLGLIIGWPGSVPSRQKITARGPDDCYRFLLDPLERLAAMAIQYALELGASPALAFGFVFSYYFVFVLDFAVFPPI